MSVQLLDKTKKINDLLHNTQTGRFSFVDIGEVLSKVLDSNTLIISKKGKLLGIGYGDETPVLLDLLAEQVGEKIDNSLNERLLAVLSVKENVNLQTLGFSGDIIPSMRGIISPIEISGERLGTIFSYRKDAYYEMEDIILSDYAAIIVGLEMKRALADEYAEEIRRDELLTSAIRSLSPSELHAVICIFDELGSGEGMIVASKIADENEVTRSVIVSAMRKLESAGVVESRSLGVKGTYVCVQNDKIFGELEAARTRRPRRRRMVSD